MNNICEDPKAFITLPTIFDFYTEVCHSAHLPR